MSFLVGQIGLGSVLNFISKITVVDTSFDSTRAYVAITVLAKKELYTTLSPKSLIVCCSENLSSTSSLDESA